MDNKDLVDNLIDDWQREAPSLDTSGIAVVGRVVQLGRLLEQRVQVKLKPYGLIYTDFDLLATLRRTGGDYCLTPTELRESVLLTSGAMTAALDRLEGMGLIERVRTKSDRRSMSARLTPAGLALLDKVLQLRFDDANTLIAKLTTEESETTASALRKLLLSVHESSSAPRRSK
ncbi:MAG: MarR family transcriptional regulator [Pseudomonadota bacterium]